MRMRTPVLAAAVLAVPVLTTSAMGQQRTWTGVDGVSDGKWSNNANWNVNPSPPFTGWQLGAATGTHLATDMDGNYSLERLFFANNNGYSVSSSTGSTLTLRGAGAGSGFQIFDVDTDRIATVNVPVVLDGVAGPTTFRTITVSGASGLLTLNGSLDAGGHEIRKAGTGALVLNSANSNIPTLAFNNGLLGLGHNQALGTGVLRYVLTTGNHTLYAAGSSRTLNNTFTVGTSETNTLRIGASTTVGDNFDLTLTGPFQVVDSAGNVTPTGLARLDIRPLTLTINGQLSGGELRTIGANGVLVLTNDNSNLAAVAPIAGTIRAAHPNALGQTFIHGRENGTATTLVAHTAPQTIASNITLTAPDVNIEKTLVLGETGGHNLTFTGPAVITGLNTDPSTNLDFKRLGVTSGVTAEFTNTISSSGGNFGIGKVGGGTLILSGNNTYTGRTVIVGGTLVMTGNNSALTGQTQFIGQGTLQVDGNNSGSNTLVGAGRLRGTGTVRDLSVFDDTNVAGAGGTVSPGTDTTVGTLNARRIDLGTGGNIHINLVNALSTPGMGWDLISLDPAAGQIEVNADPGTFTIVVDGSGVGFNPFQDWSFTFIKGTSVSNFSPAAFVVDSTNFAGDLMGGSFSVVSDGQNLQLTFAAIPEPSSAVMLVLTAGWLMRRRSR